MIVLMLISLSGIAVYYLLTPPKLSDKEIFSAYETFAEIQSYNPEKTAVVKHGQHAYEKPTFL
ncbi:hypothetical protein [Ferviditalea candida]|uniref:Uncharacterized protein n=1 Tax=Ferviditalea candida TaxID=3108399 RepID=A0ABU5ZC27_9BACL|nr:hypothetical protein [Paenibacillaceae bacterium T2]